MIATKHRRSKVSKVSIFLLENNFDSLKISYRKDGCFRIDPHIITVQPKLHIHKESSQTQEIKLDGLIISQKGLENVFKLLVRVSFK